MVGVIVINIVCIICKRRLSTVWSRIQDPVT